MASIEYRAAFLGLTACMILAAGCGDARHHDKDKDDVSSRDAAVEALAGERKRKSRLPTCIESATPIKRCFESLDDYGKWKQCVEEGNDPVKCYIKVYEVAERPPPPPESGSTETDPPEPPAAGDYPPGRHFQFDYIIRPLSDEQVTYLQDWGDINTLIDRTSCRFVSQDPTEVRRELRVRQNHTGYDLRFDVAGDSPGCSGPRAIHFKVDFLILHPGLALYATHDDTDPNDPPRVLVDRTNFIMSDDRYTYFTWHSYDANEVATASFEFIAESATSPGVFLIGFNGHMELKRNE